MATHNPIPGDPVFSLGLSPGGLSWTIRPCTVMGIGRLREHASGILTELDPEAFAEGVADDSHLTAQVGCADYSMSGSPILDVEGRLAGIQQFFRFERTESKSRELRWYFFIAPSEIQAFLEEG